MAIFLAGFSANAVLAQESVSITLQTIGSGDIYYYGKNVSSFTATVGDSVALKAEPYNGWHFVRWQRDSITVSTNAIYSFTVTPYSGGTITARFEQNVTPPPAQPKVKFNYANLSLKPQETAILEILVNDTVWNAMDWASSNTEVATVASGLITAITDGKAEITAKVKIDNIMYSAHCMVYVEPVAIEINETSTVNDGIGTTEVALEIPNQMLFTGSFTVELPAGVSIDPYATQLAEGYEGLLDLNIEYFPESTWKFTFTIISGARQSNFRATLYATTNKIVDIVYNVAETFTDDFELKIKDLSLVLEDAENTIIERQETIVPVTNNNSQTGINIVSEKSLTIYPNPVKDNLYIVSANPIGKVAIYTLTGKMVKSEWISGNSINVSQLPQGIYLIKVGNYLEKFVKK